MPDTGQASVYAEGWVGELPDAGDEPVEDEDEDEDEED